MRSTLSQVTGADISVNAKGVGRGRRFVQTSQVLGQCLSKH